MRHQKNEKAEALPSLNTFTLQFELIISREPALALTPKLDVGDVSGNSRGL